MIAKVGLNNDRHALSIARELQCIQHLKFEWLAEYFEIHIFVLALLEEKAKLGRSFYQRFFIGRTRLIDHDYSFY